MKGINIKPCPFCGGEASIYHGDSTDGYIKGTDYVLAFCGWCGASIREKKKDEVIKKWNKRPNPWHTDTPTEEGDYVFLTRDGSYLLVNKNEYGFWIEDKYGYEEFIPTEGYILAYQKIEPYKENEDGRTD